MRLRNPTILIVALFVGAALPGVPSAQTFVGLGTGSEVETVVPSPISADGSVVVGWTQDAGHAEAFRWIAGTGVVGLGFLQVAPGTEPVSAAHAVSPDGSAVVGDSNGRAFRWTAQNGMVGLGILPPRVGFQQESLAQAVSAEGSVVAGTSTGEAFRWTGPSGMVGLGFLGCCILLRTSAYLMSVDGSVVIGTWSTPDTVGSGGFRWTNQQGMADLGRLPPDEYTLPRDISVDGSVIVGVSSGKGFRWTGQGGMTEIGVLPSAASADGSIVVGGRSRWTTEDGLVSLGDEASVSSVATDISDDGSIVIGTHQVIGPLGSVPFEPFIWDRANGVQSIIEILANLGVSLTGWTLSRPGEIFQKSYPRVSGNGRTIVGNGRNPSGNPEAWVAILTCPNDNDCDAVSNAGDNCPVLRTSNISDADGNGIGNECECGDQNRDGRVNVSDLVAINRAIFIPSQVTPLCDTNNDDLCDVRDIIGANLKILGQPAYCSRYPPPAL